MLPTNEFTRKMEAALRTKWAPYVVGAALALLVATVCFAMSGDWLSAAGVGGAGATAAAASYRAGRSRLLAEAAARQEEASESARSAAMDARKASEDRASPARDADQTRSEGNKWL